MKVFLRLLTLVLLGLLPCSPLLAKSSGKVKRGLPGALIFPHFDSAALINASTLVHNKGTAVQGLYSPPPSSGETHQYQLGVASASKKFGLGMGYTGYSDTQATHGAFAGLGFLIETLSLGLSIRDPNVENDFDPDVDFGLDLAIDKSVHLGVVLYNINRTPNVALGVGYVKENKYFLEANLGFQNVNNIDTSNYTLTLAAGVYAGIFGMGFQTNYYASSKDYDHILSGLIRPSDNLHFLVQFETPRRFRFGLTVVF